MSKGQLVIFDSTLFLSDDLLLLKEIIKAHNGLDVDIATEALFAGQLEEELFWHNLKDETKVDDYTINSWREEFRQQLLPRSEIEHLEGWRKRTNLGLSANFFAPWLRRSLKTADVLRHIKYTWISSETGQIKPDDPDVFTAAFALGLQTLYLDVNEQNLELADGYGFEALLATKDWPKAVDLWID